MGDTKVGDRYRVEDHGEKTGFGVVVDTMTGREVCEADSCETPEDASVIRAFAPLLAECNALARALAEAEERVRRAETARVDASLNQQIAALTLEREEAISACAAAVRLATAARRKVIEECVAEVQQLVGVAADAWDLFTIMSRLRSLADEPRPVRADYKPPADVRSYLTDDADIDSKRHRLDLSRGENGDWYLSILPAADRFTRACVRITTSGTKKHDLPSAMWVLWDALGSG